MKNKLASHAFAKPMTAATALALAVSMSPVAAIAAPSSDNDVADSAITITGLQNNDTVSAYQIADIDINADNTLKYAFATGVPEAYNSVDKLKGITSDGYSFTQGSDMQNAAAAIANGIVANGATTTATATGTEATLTLPSGYYLVRVTSTSGTSKVYQNMVVDVTPKAQADGTYASHDAEKIAVKSTEVTVTKTVGSDYKEKTDSYQVGDTVPFKITTAIPNYPADSPNATFVIGDVPTAGLSIDVDSIKVDGADAANYTLNASATGYTIEFKKNFILEHPGQSITVTYNAKVTKDAFSTSDSVTGNTATVTFNPNPYATGTATPKDTTAVQTYGYVFDKTGKEGKALEGAVFTLCDTSGNPVFDENGAEITSTSTVVGGKAYVYFSGLKSGDYKAKETTVPAGYAAVKDIEISVSSAEATGDNPATTDVTENNFKVNTSSVQDPEAPALPVTGGAGTMAVTVAGVAFIGGAAYLIVRSRKRGEE